MNVVDVLDRKVRASLGGGWQREIALSRRELEAFDTKLLTEGKQCKMTELIAREEDENENDGVVAAAVRADLEWSDEAPAFDKLSRPSVEYVLANVRTLRLQQCAITALGNRLGSFASLRELNLSGNELTRIGSGLPLGLQSFQAFGNAVCTADVVAPNLLHLGLGFNPVSSLAGLVGLLCLESLDVSYASLVDLNGTIESLSQLPNLRILRVEGNPFCLLVGYRTAFMRGLDSLTNLGGTSVQAEAQQVSDAPVETSALPVTFTITVSIESVHLPRVPAPTEELGHEGKEPERRPSAFFLEAFMPNGSMQRSEQAENPTEASSVNFAFVAAVTAKPCVSVRDAIDLSGVTITFTAIMPRKEIQDEDKEQVGDVVEDEREVDGGGREGGEEETEQLLCIGSSTLDLKQMFVPSSDGRSEFVQEAAFGIEGATAAVTIQLNPDARE